VEALAQGQPGGGLEGGRSDPPFVGTAAPELVIVSVDAAIGRNEGDPEIRSLVVGSAGDNEPPRELTDDHLRDQSPRPLPRPAKLHHIPRSQCPGRR